jgi:acetyltransferase
LHNRALHCPTLKPPDPIAIRPLQPQDAPQLAEFLSRLSDETRYLRFLTIIRRFTPEQLEQLTQLRPDRDVALAAVTSNQGSEEIVGVARYAGLSDPRRAEFALVVRDDLQGHGIGTELMQALIKIAHAQGLQCLEGLVLATNHKMLELMSHLGFQVMPDAQDPTMRRVVCNLTAPVVANAEADPDLISSL